MSTLPPCEYEDSANCYWNATSAGNGQGTSFIDLGGTAYYADTVTPANDGMSVNFTFPGDSPIIDLYPSSFPDGVLCWTDLADNFVCNVFTGREVTPDDDTESYVPTPPTGTETTTETETVVTPPALAETGSDFAHLPPSAWVLPIILVAAGALLLLGTNRNRTP